MDKAAFIREVARRMACDEARAAAGEARRVMNQLPKNLKPMWVQAAQATEDYDIATTCAIGRR